MAKKAGKLPASYGGLVRYFDEYKSSLTIKPEHAIIVTVIVIIFQFILNLAG
ncbi:MAG: preprotein translocase subunit Sec61beta [Candidatus Undinarchaeales archaeon]|jgi:preprotein translocase subunit Sec61beta|nr:preprotein translocase subunit Sec61beta [Candidatus Undinarchaeales archaeon]MDP7494632.1 preprotein translocase subunit Sec61beta [Candidatus Undinarchaeales archaeon]